MKKVKKLLAVMMAVAMVFTMSATAFAQNVDSGNGGKGTITVTNASKGVTYTVYKVFDAKVGKSGEIVYTTDKDLNDNAYFEKNASGNVVAKPAAKDGEKLSAGAIAWIKDNGTKVATGKGDGTALTFTGLEYGYYYITSSLKDNGVISVTSTNPNGTVNDKNSVVPTWTPDTPDPDQPGDTNYGGKAILVNGKTVKENDMNIGDTATFRLSINTTNYVDGKQIRDYVVNDTLPDGFDFVKIKSVKVGGANADYTATDGGFPIAVPWVNLDGASIYDANATMVIEYEAKLNDKAVIDGLGNRNKAQFGWHYTDDPTDPENPDKPVMPDPTTKPDQLSTESSTTTYTYALALKKVNEKGEALIGAEFEVPFNVAGTAGDYTVAGEGKTKVQCDENGIVIIKGVKEGTHKITETVAPDGYNKIVGEFDVEAVKTGGITTNTKVYMDKDGNVSKTETETHKTEVSYTNDTLSATLNVVVNKSGTLLPGTGGMGTKIFTAVGAILMLAALVMFITKRKMKDVK